MKTNTTTSTEGLFNLDNDYNSSNFIDRKQYEEDLKRKQTEHLNNINNKQNINWQPCLHDSCSECLGTGVKKDGSICVHNIHCSCPKCSVYY